MRLCDVNHTYAERFYLYEQKKRILCKLPPFSRQKTTISNKHFVMTTFCLRKSQIFYGRCHCFTNSDDKHLKMSINYYKWPQLNILMIIEMISEHRNRCPFSWTVDIALKTINYPNHKRMRTYLWLIYRLEVSG